MGDTNLDVLMRHQGKDNLLVTEANKFSHMSLSWKKSQHGSGKDFSCTKDELKGICSGFLGSKIFSRLLCAWRQASGQE